MSVVRLTVYRRATVRFTIAVALALAGHVHAHEKPNPVNRRPLPDKVTFNAHIRPIMSNTCFVCHGPDDADNESGFRLDSYDHAVATLPSDQNLRGIVPADPMRSEVYLRITDQSEAGDQMPPTGFRHRLSDYDIQLFRRWIEQGAKYEQHWSYAPILAIDPPQVDDPDQWIKNPIDAFILARLATEELRPSSEADRATLLRRLSLDLVGLPPSPQEVADFVNDDGDDAYQRAVERLLKSPHFGERMASYWLDLVRFADTVGFHGDQNQRIFPYRDYVINAFNSNMPFDQFTREQLAGDLLPNPTEQQLVATGFLRLNMMTREGGAQPGEYLAKYKADRVRALGTAWLGSTLGCCECHNHKYDPFTAKDFYAFGAFFDDIRQWGVYSDYGYTPNPDLKGFTNDYPFPPEMRIDSESLRDEIAIHQRMRDQQLYPELGAATLHSSDFAEWQSEMQGALEKWPNGWVPLSVGEATSSAGTAMEQECDGSLTLTASPTADDVIEVRAHVPQSIWVAAIRLEAIPSPRHGGYVGRGRDGRFTIDGVNFSLDAIPESSPEMTPTRPRFIRIELPGSDRILSLAEVEVLVDTADGEQQNIALNAHAIQSSDYQGVPADRAIDGNTDGDFRAANSVTHTASQTDPWWELDLGEPHTIAAIRVWNRTDGNLGNRLKDARLVLLDEARRRLLDHPIDLPTPTTSIVPPAEVEIPTTTPIQVSWTQADRLAPYGYQSGHEPSQLELRWRSGPARWQLPSDEARLPHTAVHHLEHPQRITPDTSLVANIRSADVGRIRLAVTPLGHAIAGWDACNEALRQAIFRSRDGRTPSDEATLVSAFHRSTVAWESQSPTCQVFRERILKLRAGKAMSLVASSIDPDEIPESRVLPRGNWQDATGEPAPPGFPGFLPDPVDEAVDRSRRTRLDLANWLTSTENPLTSRHFVNRTWKQFFGKALSAKLEDLGNQGEWPSHPELLDWLAADFMASGWDVKQLVRLIVTSSTYRQASAVRDDLVDIDPYNRLLAQQSPRRLEAEIVRDNALAAAGLLITDYIGGPSVFPYQPKGHYRDLQFPNRRYEPSDDWRQYRRGVYIHWQRTFLHPMLVNFDAPSRDECTADRSISNSPQQALTLLNDPTFVEASIALALRLSNEVEPADFSKQLDHAYLLTLARKPTDRERQGLRSLHDQHLASYQNEPKAARMFLESVRAGRPTMEWNQAERVRLAALAQVCRVVLNLHETITRY